MRIKLKKCTLKRNLTEIVHNVESYLTNLYLPVLPLLHLVARVPEKIPYTTKHHDGKNLIAPAFLRSSVTIKENFE